MTTRTGATTRAGVARQVRPLRRIWLAAPAALVAFVALGRTGAHAAETTVEISGFSFVPEEFAISVGDTVTWVNKDQDDHDLQQGKEPGEMDSPPLKPGDSYSFQFTEARDVTYTCSIHTYMKGTIHVAGHGGGSGEAPPTTTATPPPSATTTTTAPSGLVPLLPVGSPDSR
ncbi:MAG: plastocyanin/azurin family copper-binding protein [Acidimicrobiia bacterium]